jgi:hypothetical protein
MYHAVDVTTRKTGVSNLEKQICCGKNVGKKQGGATIRGWKTSMETRDRGIIIRGEIDTVTIRSPS